MAALRMVYGTMLSSPPNKVIKKRKRGLFMEQQKQKRTRISAKEKEKHKEMLEILQEVKLSRIFTDRELIELNKFCLAHPNMGAHNVIKLGVEAIINGDVELIEHHTVQYEIKRE